MTVKGSWVEIECQASLYDTAKGIFITDRSPAIINYKQEEKGDASILFAKDWDAKIKIEGTLAAHVVVYFHSNLGDLIAARLLTQFIQVNEKPESVQ